MIIGRGLNVFCDFHQDIVALLRDLLFGYVLAYTQTLQLRDPVRSYYPTSEPLKTISFFVPKPNTKRLTFAEVEYGNSDT